MKKILSLLLAIVIVIASVMPSYAGIYDGCIKWTDASNHIGEYATVYGKVVDTYYAKNSNGAPTFLNVGAAYPNSQFTVVIFEDARYKFSGSPEKMYYGKNIKVTGTIKWYKTYAEIIVKKPSQIEIVK